MLLSSGSSDYRKFLLSDDVYLNGRLAKIYGAKLPENAPFQKVDFEPSHRAGVLSHPYLLASLAYTSCELADPSRRFSFAQRVGPRAAAARAVRGPATAGDPRRADDSRARRPADPSQKRARVVTR